MRVSTGFWRGRPNSEAAVGQTAGEVSRGILSMMLIEKEFINTNDKSALKDYNEVLAGVKGSIERILKVSADAGILAQIREIEKLCREHETTFQEVAKNNEASEQTKSKLSQTIRQLQSILEDAIALIDKQENQLNMAGDDLDNTTNGIRREIKSFLSFWYVKQLHIQDLLLFARLDDYQKREAELAGKLKLAAKNIESLILAAKGNDVHGAMARSPEVGARD